MPRKFYSLNDIATIRDNPGAMLWELHQAAAYGDKERVLECLEAGADINGRNPDFGVTALMLAAAGGYWEIAKLFLDRGAVADIRRYVVSRVRVISKRLSTLVSPFVMPWIRGILPRGGTFSPC